MHIERIARETNIKTGSLMIIFIFVLLFCHYFSPAQLESLAPAIGKPVIGHLASAINGHSTSINGHTSMDANLKTDQDVDRLPPKHLDSGVYNFLIIFL